MARSGTGFFDKRGQFFRTPEEAKSSDLAALLGKIGEGDSLAPGIANMLLEKRKEIEKIYEEHDLMTEENLGEISLPSMENVAQLRKST